MIWHTSEPIKPDNLHYSPAELKKLIILTRLSRYNRNAKCGAKYIQWELKTLDIRPLPSLSFIANVLRKEGLTYRRTGNY
jgi:hypothetical protein